MKVKWMMIRKKLKGKNFKIQGTGDELRSFIFIKDFINAFKLIQKKGKHLQIYNIGTNQKIRIKDLAKKISKILNKDIIIKKSKLKKGSTKIRVPDISRIKHLGFSQIFSLDEGIKEIIFGNKF